MWSYHYFGHFNNTMHSTPFQYLMVKMKHPEDTEATANLMDDLN
jgi:hypothetical protein